MKIRKKRIAVDARFFGTKQKGLGRYCQKLVENLEKQDNSQNDYFILLTKENYSQYQPQKKNFYKLLADYHWYGFAEQVFFPRFLRKHNFDLVHFCHFNVPIFYRGSFVVTIHDLILFHFPTPRNTTLNKYFYFLKLWAYRMTITKAAKRALKIIAVSEFTKRDILKNFKGIDEEKISVTLEGCDSKRDVSCQDSEKALGKYGIKKPYLLYVGNAYPHKNLERLCLAFEEIGKKQADLGLVLVGGNDFFYERLKKYVRDRKIGKVVFSGHVPDQELDIIYENAQLYVFPSLYEGFGLPPLEALSKGIPVVSSGRTSMPEVLGSAAVYFDPENTKSMVEAIRKILNDKKLVNEMVDLGRQRVGMFSWEKTAKDTLGVYEKCLK